MALTAAEILEFMDLDVKEIEVPQWKGKVYIRKWSGLELDQYNNKLLRQTKGEDMDLTGLNAFVAFLSLSDAEGTRLFSKKEQLEALERKSASALALIRKETLSFNGLNESKEDAAALGE
jgi:hypothetical protein